VCLACLCASAAFWGQPAPVRGSAVLVFIIGWVFWPAIWRPKNINRNVLNSTIKTPPLSNPLPSTPLRLFLAFPNHSAAAVLVSAPTCRAPAPKKRKSRLPPERRPKARLSMS
jgi:hypothetical protein